MVDIKEYFHKEIVKQKRIHERYCDELKETIKKLNDTELNNLKVIIEDELNIRGYWE